VRAELREHLVGDPRLADVILVASEPVTNVLRHTSGGGRVVVEAGRPLVSRVEDSSPGEVTVNPHPRAEGGFGLGLITRLGTT